MMSTHPSTEGVIRGLRDLRIVFEAVSERVARASGLNPRDLGILDVLHAEGPVTPKWLTERTGIHPATLTAALARLQRNGHVVREPDPEDGRSVRIAIADHTVLLLAGHYEPLNLDLGSWLEAMTEAERHQIGRLLRAVTEKIIDAEASSRRAHPRSGDPGASGQLSIR